MLIGRSNVCLIDLIVVFRFWCLTIYHHILEQIVQLVFVFLCISNFDDFSLYIMCSVKITGVYVCVRTWGSVT